MKSDLFKDNNVDYSPSTLKRLSSDRILLIVCAGIAAFCDLMTLIVALVAGYGAVIYAFPLIMLIADGLFIAGVCFTNFRFRYSLALWIIYLALSAILTILMLSFNGGFFGYEVMTISAVALAVISHIVLWVVTAVCALASDFKPSVLAKATLIAVVAVAVILTFSYSVFIASNGYFGQGEDNEVRAVLFSYDEENGGYEAVGVAGGRGNKTVIPQTFNGKKVVSVSADLIFSDKLKNIVIEGNEKLVIKGTIGSNQLSDSVSVGVSREVIDEYRKELIGSQIGGAIQLANAMYPSDISQDEAYITFSYDWTESSQVRENIIPTWIGKKGEVFDLGNYALANNIEYIVNGDYTDDASLHWSMLNNAGYVFKEIVADGNNVDGKTVTENIYGAEICFDKIYKVQVLEDNDTLYEPDDTFKHTVLDGKTYEYRYVAESCADDLLDELSREGFTLKWYYDYGGTRGQINSLTQMLSDNSLPVKDSTVCVVPEWSLNAPDIQKVFTNSPTNMFVYGDVVIFDVQAIAPVEGFDLSYVWSDDTQSQEIGTQKQATLSRVTPDRTGRFSVTVKASSSLTSLTSSVVDYIDINVDKKTVRFSWSFPESAVYDGTPKQAVCDYVTEDLISGDSLYFTTDIVAVTNAGTYTNKATLTNDSAEYYKTDTSASYTYSIAKCPVVCVWDESEIVYNGSVQHPAVISLTDAVSAEEADVIESLAYSLSGGINAGTYTVRASLPVNSNYVIKSDGSKTYTIAKKEVSLVWQEQSEFVFNGEYSYPKATDITGVLEEDMNVVFGNLVYEGYGRNAGEYTVSAKFGAGSSNYTLIGSTQKIYSITQKPINVNALATDKVYDGEAGGEFSVSVSGLVGSDTLASLGTPVYGGNAVSAVYVGDYTLSVSFEENAVNRNYDITYTPDTFSISKKTLTVNALATDKVYDGEAGGVFSVSASGLVTKDTLKSLGTPQYADDAVSAINVGDYTLSVSYAENDINKNYDISYVTDIFTISQKQLTVNAVATDKVYDGIAGGAFSVKATGLVTKDTVESLGVPQFGGDAVSAVNIGNYTLSVSFEENEINKNYAITYNTDTFTISPRTLTAEWSGISEFEYDGNTHAPYITINESEYAQQVKVVYTYYTAEDVILEGAPINAGSYKVSAKLADGYTNFLLSGVTQKSYTINKKQLTVSAVATDKVYDGTAGGEFSVKATGLVTKDTVEALGEPQFGGDAVSAVDAGEYTLSVSFEENEINKNYAISYETDTFVISPKTIAAIWSDETVFDFDESTHAPYVVTEGQEYDGQVTVSYTYYTISGEKLETVPSQVGEYYVEAEVESKNYVLSDLRKDFEIRDAEEVQE